MEAAEIEQMAEIDMTASRSRRAGSQCRARAIRDAFFGRHESDDEVRYTAIDLQHQKYIVLG